MKRDWLFPHRYRQIGWFFFIPSALLGLVAMYGDALGRTLAIPFIDSRIFDSFSDEIAAMGVLVSLLFIAFAREKTEDEMIRQLRLESLQWSIYANYFLLALAIVFIYDEAFFAVLVYNMFTILIVFIARFRWSLKRIERPEEVIV